MTDQYSALMQAAQALAALAQTMPRPQQAPAQQAGAQPIAPPPVHQPAPMPQPPNPHANQAPVRVPEPDVGVAAPIGGYSMGEPLPSGHVQPAPAHVHPRAAVQNPVPTIAAQAALPPQLHMPAPGLQHGDVASMSVEDINAAWDAHVAPQIVQ